MKKLALDVFALAVESFVTDGVATKRTGTVDAYAATLVHCGSGGASCFTSCRADLRDACTCPPP